MSWDPKLVLEVAEEKKEAARMVEQDDADIQCFLDGSGFKGGVGAVSVMFVDGKEEGVL